MIDDWMRREIDDTEVAQNLRRYIAIDVKSRNDLIASLNFLKHNATKYIALLEDSIIEMNGEYQVWYSDNELADIFNISNNAVKKWRLSGKLNYRQEKKGCKVEINRKDVDDFVEKNIKYKHTWTNWKKIKY